MKILNLSETSSCFDEIDVWIADVRTVFSWRDDPLELGRAVKREDLMTIKDALYADSIFKRLLLSPTFLAKLQYFQGVDEVPIFTESQNGSGGTYNEYGEIHINQDIRNHYGDDINPILWIAAHEFRHAWQDEIGIFDLIPHLNARELLMLERAYEADCVAFQLTVCWELKEQGDPAVWKHVKKNYPKEALAFEKSVKKNPESLHSGIAQNEAVKTWLSNVRNFDFYDSKSLARYTNYRVKQGNRFSFNPTTQLGEKVYGLGKMPYFDKKGNLRDRDNYFSSNDRKLSVLLNEGYLGAGTSIHLRHLERLCAGRITKNGRPRPHFTA